MNSRHEERRKQTKMDIADVRWDRQRQLTLMGRQQAVDLELRFTQNNLWSLFLLLLWKGPYNIQIKILRHISNDLDTQNTCSKYQSKVGDCSRGWPEYSLFNSYHTLFPGLPHFTLDPYLIVLSARQSGIKYNFLSLWYDSTWDWTAVSRIIGQHSTH